MAGMLKYALSLDTAKFTGPARLAKGSIMSIGGAAMKTAGLVAKLGTGLTALGASAGALASLKKAADMEQLNVSMEVLIGNADEAKRVLGELTQFAGATPFSTREVMEAGKNLIALGSNTKTLTAELRALGDVSSGMSIPLKDMVDIYGKARTQGTLYAEDLNQLAGRGIPIFKELARVLGVNQSEIKKMASEGQITFPMLQKVFSDLTAEGGKFHKMMQKQSGTTNGLLSTLRSEMDNLLIAIGTPLKDFLKPILSKNIARMQILNQRVTGFLQLLKEAKSQGKLGDFLGTGLQLALMKGVNAFFSGVRGTIAYLAAAVPTIFKSGTDILTSERTRIFFESIFKGAGDFLASKVRAVLAQFLDGIGKVRMARQLRDLSQADANRAEMRFSTAAQAIKTSDFDQTLKKLFQDLKVAHSEGKKAFSEAAKNPLFQTEALEKRFAKLGMSIDPDAMRKILNPSVTEVVKQTKTLEEALVGLNTSIKKNTPKAPSKKLAPLRQMIAPIAEDDAPKKRRGIRSAGDAALAKLLSGRRLTNTEDMAIRRDDPARPLKRNGRPLNPKRAAEQLARANRAAQPGQARREDVKRMAEARRLQQPLIREVQAIKERFDDLVTA